MLTTILSTAGGGKSFLTIKKALQASKEKRLLILTYEMSSYHILKRVNACLDYLHIEGPKKITVQEKDLNGVVVPVLFEEILNKLFNEYDVIVLDGYFLNRMYSDLNLDAQDTTYELKKCLKNTLKHNPDKQIIVNMNTNRPIQVLDDGQKTFSEWNQESILKIKEDFFKAELNIDDEENILILRENQNRFHTFDFNKKTHDSFSGDDFLFGMNKK